MAKNIELIPLNPHGIVGDDGAALWRSMIDHLRTVHPVWAVLLDRGYPAQMHKNMRFERYGREDGVAVSVGFSGQEAFSAYQIQKNVEVIELALEKFNVRISTFLDSQEG